MKPSRRQLLQLTATAAATAAPPAEKPAKRRTLYYNDARHYYLFVFEPPMRLEDAWRPVDEVAGTAVDTLVYGVERGDGLFYPSKVGMRFGADIQPFTLSAYWRVWQNMQSLIDRGLDPLEVLRDRARAKGLDFFASVRMSSHGGMNPKFKVTEGGRGMAHPALRDHQFAVLEELAVRYRVDGIELDFAAAPGGMPPIVRQEEAKTFAPVLTDYVGRIARMARARSGKPCHVAARVYPTEAMCLGQGMDVRAWLRSGIVDSVTPMLYIDFNLDPDMPFAWLTEAAKSTGTAVYPMLQPYARDEATGSAVRIAPSPEVMRAAAANYWDRGADGLYTWFMNWPLGNAERRMLSELGDPDLIRRETKRYVLRRRSKQATELGYAAALPVEIKSASPGRGYAVRFHVTDDVASTQPREVVLRVLVTNLVMADEFSVRLNGQPLAGEPILHSAGNSVSPYSALWLEYRLVKNRPRRGENVLEVSLDRRPAKLQGGVTVEEIEVLIEYGTYG
ncbi:MAG: hypothetical protein FJW39_31000 [Acidobacteria bacterium]|nr:hypothetical protein [Acidobacteriota bacterium]